MKVHEHEGLTSEIAGSVFSRFEGIPPDKVVFGGKSKWRGHSGFVHQVDVAVRGRSDLIFVECKHWHTKKVKVEHVLTFIARIADLRPMIAESLHAVFFTSNQFQPGCHTLAKHYAIDLAVAASADSFAFEYKGMRVLGVPPGKLGLTGLRHAVV